jgi:hypothetical protein
MIGRLTICGISLLALGGCLSRPQPFVQSVAAAPLRPIGLSAPVPDPVLPPRTEAKPSLLADLDADATPADVAVEEPAPERTNIQGADDGSMMVETVVVVARNVPHRAPDYSPEQTASMVCLAQKTGFSVSNARRAHEATVAAKAADQRFGAGLATLKEVDDAERKRQDAVRDFIMPVPLLGFFFDGAQKKADLPPPRQGEMVIEDADLFFFTEHGKEVMAVSGVVRNTGARPAELPPVTLAALDAWEFQLAGQTSLLPFERLAPGEALVDRAEVAREQRGLLAAGAGTDLDDAVAAVVATFGQQVVDQRVVLFGRTAFEVGQFGLGEVREFTIRAGRERPVLLEVALDALQRPVALHNRRARAEFALQCSEALGALQRRGVGRPREQLLDAGDHAVELLLDARAQATHAALPRSRCGWRRIAITGRI